jgi:Kdo2-lipid IVA lauroyltransferase/acyltransferase
MIAWIQYAAVWCFLQFLGNLPKAQARFLSVALVRCLYNSLPRLRKTAQINLELAFPAMTAAERERLTLSMLRNLGWMAVEFARFPRYTAENIDQILVLDGQENFLESQRQGRGVLFLTCHIGAWELSSFAHALYGHPLHYMARHIDNPRVDHLINSYRCLSGNRPIFKNESARAVLKILTDRGTVGILADQNTMPQEAVFVDFFGKAASTSTGLARLALHTGAAVVPGYAVWDATARKYRLRFEPPVRLAQTGDPEQDVLANTQRFTKIIEEIVRKYPDQWVWVHGRWKVRPPGEAPIYPWS